MKNHIIAFSALLVVALLLAACQTTTRIYPPQGQPSQPAQPSAPSQVTTPPASAANTASPAAPVTAPAVNEVEMPEIKLCEDIYGIGWVPNSCRFEEGNVRITLKAVGKNGIDGIAFYIIGPSGVQKTLRDGTRVEQGAVQTYSFSTKTIEDKVGGKVGKIYALPIKKVNGQDNACFNHRLLIISAEACKA
jgi:hypothetical protein